MSLLSREGLCEGSFACVRLRRAEIRAAPGGNRLLFAGDWIRVMEGMESVLVSHADVLGLWRMLV